MVFCFLFLYGLKFLNASNNTKKEIGFQMRESGFNPYIYPVHYDININLDHQKNMYSGFVKIKIDFKSSQENMILKSSNLKIKKICFDNYDAKWKQKKNSNLKIYFEQAHSGSHVLEIFFEGNIYTKRTEGFIKIENSDANIYLTNFGYNNARSVFPCFDSTLFKTTFLITVQTNNEKYSVISNTKRNEITESKNGNIWSFKKTPLLNLRCLGFVIGEFNQVSRGNISVYTIQKKQQGLFALKVIKKTLKFLTRLLGTKLTHEKLDVVAIPDLSSIRYIHDTYGYILIEERRAIMYAETTIPHIISMYESINLKIAMQWFSCMITETFPDAKTILNGLSYWAGNCATENLFSSRCTPDKSEIVLKSPHESYSNSDEHILTGDEESMTIDYFKELFQVDFDSLLVRVYYDRVMDFDFLRYRDKKRIEDIGLNRSFTSIKISFIIRLLEKMSSPTAIRNLITRFLENNKFGMVRYIDFFYALKTINPNLNENIKPWLSQVGYPLITVYNNAITQERFLPITYTDKSSPWTIPLEIKYSLNDAVHEYETLFNEKELYFDTILEEGYKIISVNESSINMTRLQYRNQIYASTTKRSFRRVNDNSSCGIFPSRTQQKEKSHLTLPFGKTFEQLSPVSRMIFLTDIFALEKAGRVCICSVLAFLKKIPYEAETFGVTRSFLVSRKRLLPNNPSIHSTFREIINNQSKDFSFLEAKNTRLRQNLVLSAMELGDQPEIPDNHLPCYTLTWEMKEARRAENISDFLVKYKEKNPIERTRMIRTMSFHLDPKDIIDFLSHLLSSDVYNEDKENIFLCCLISHTQTTISYIIENFEQLEQALTPRLFLEIVSKVVLHTPKFSNDEIITRSELGRRCPEIKYYVKDFRSGVDLESMVSVYKENLCIDCTEED